MAVNKSAQLRDQRHPNVAAVNDYATAVIDGCTADRIAATTRFDHGENHAVYRVSYLDEREAERDVVVRISNADRDADRRQAQREAAVLDHLRGAASPRLLHFAADTAFGGRAVMCLEYIDGRFEPLPTAAPGKLAELGSIVRRAHGVPIDTLAPILNGTPEQATYVQDRLGSMLARMSLVRDPLPRSVQNMFTDATKWATQTAEHLQAFDDRHAPVLLHGDVSAGNILWTPHPVLIDWEYARIGDPADEIAYLFGQNALRTDQREAFWRGYGHGLECESSGRIVERAAAWEPLTLFGSALYWIDLWSRSVRAQAAGSVDPSAPKDPAYYLDIAMRYLSRADPPR